MNTHTQIRTLIATLLTGSVTVGLLIFGGGIASADPPSAKKVERIYNAKCASCHGKDGKGQTEQGQKEGCEDMTLASWHDARTDAKIKKSIAEGLSEEIDGKTRKMKAFADVLEPEEIDALVVYVRAFKAAAP